MFFVAVVIAVIGLLVGLAGAACAFRERSQDAHPEPSQAGLHDGRRAAHPELDRWRAIRRGLGPGDRFAVVTAQVLGRPVTDPRLASAAHVRGASAVTETRRAMAPDSPIRQLRWLLFGLASVQVSRSLDRVADGEVLGWVLLTSNSASAALCAALPALQNGILARLERSLDGTPPPDREVSRRVATALPAG